MAIAVEAGTRAGAPAPKRRRALLLREVLTPQSAVLVPAILSLVAWCIPGGNRVTQGFTFRSQLGVGSFGLLVAWYIACVAVLSLASAMGRQTRPLGRASSKGRRADVERRAYVLVTLTATLGVAYSVVKVATTLPVLQVLQARQANALYAALPEGFGLQTLRYAAALSAAVAVHRVVTTRRLTPLTAWNVVLLALTSVLASRLSVVLAGVVFLYLLTRSHPHLRVRPGLIVVGAVVFFLLLLPLSYSRNAAFYEQAGVRGPVAVNAAQIWSYLSAPTQVAIGVADAAVSDGFGVVGSVTDASAVLRPTYLQPDKVDKGAALDLGKYGNYVDVEPYYNTNSVFADTLASYGLTGLLFALAALWLAGFLYGHLGQYGGLASCGAGVLLYAFVETWRVFLLNQGIIHFLVITAVALHVAAATLRATVSRRSPAAAVQAG